MPILIILVAILVVFFVGGALLESIGSLLGVTIFAGANVVKRIRNKRAQKKSARAAADLGLRRIEVSCPCSEKFQVNIKKAGGVLMFTCPRCGQKLRVDTSKMVH